MKMSPHFSLAELTVSDKARALGIPNSPTPAHTANGKKLALGLEWVRAIVSDKMGKDTPVRITSAYRNPQVNAAVGGVANSDHAEFEAGDIEVPGLSAWELATLLLHSRLVYDQLILETSRGVVHVSFDVRYRMQALTQKGKHNEGTLPGIVK